MSPLVGLLVWPFAATIVIVAIHAYLGLHVVEREVIFVDLSLAQMAALGTAVATLPALGAHEPQSVLAYGLAFLFAVLGAAIFALTRSESRRIPHEAIIGIVYAVSAAAAVLVLNSSPHGAEDIKDILIGNLLAVGPRDVVRLSVLYAILGAVHWLWRQTFLLISEDPEEARRRGVRLKVWDFLFYVLFGVVVTNSVGIVGVLLVFSYLIVPAVAAKLLARRLSARLAIAWAMGIGASFIGLWLSATHDVPPGATIVCVLGAMLVVTGLLRPRARERAPRSGT
jgi:zinc/manganese transport system permease protein